MNEKEIYIGLALAVAVIVGYAWKAYEQKNCNCGSSS